MIPLPTLSVRGVRFVTAVLTLTFVFATAIGTTGLVAQRGTVALGASTTLTIIAGEVSIGDGSGTIAPARDGDVLQAGMVIRTGPASYAIFTYFEGSSVSLEPETELVIEALQANPDGSTIVGMRQRIGKTWHAVAKLLRVDSKYEVRTPTGAASVRGTAFEVDVVHDEQGEVISIVTTSEGAVATTKQPTPEVPRPPEVIVPAGFQVTVRTTEPIEPPQRAPEPQRKVTVTVEAESSVVVDPVGRANGIKDGKVVRQTPGAKVEKVNGKLVVTLPRIPDGKVTTVVDRASAPEVRITTTVTELGKGERTVTERVPAPDITRVVTGVELKRQDQDRPSELRRLGESEKRDAPAPKLPEPPKPPKPPEPPKPKDAGSTDRDKEQAPGDVGAKQEAPRFVKPIVQFTLPPLSSDEAAKREEATRRAEQRAKEEAAKRDEERRTEAEKRLEDLRRAEQRAKDEAARLADERRRAEDRRRDEDRRRAEERAKEEASKRQGEQRGGEGERRTEAPALGLIPQFQPPVVPVGPSPQPPKAEAPRAEEERRKSEDKSLEELKRAQQKAIEEGAKLADERRRAEEKARQGATKREEERRSGAEKRLGDVRQQEDRLRQEAAKLNDERRRAEEQRLEEQRRSEQRQRQEAERRLEQLRREAERASEEKGRQDQEKKQDEGRRRDEERRQPSRFVPNQTLPPLTTDRGNP